ncbi:MAG: hypothetical protein Q8M94_16035, partial [Ignavibacteria bacterium]|nr:hypothetical protein [Ignavibacteria bacterium]
MKNIILVFVLFTLQLNAQFVEGNYGSNFNHYPVNTIKMFGVGNRGFDDYLGIYNPKYFKDDSTITLSISVLSDLSANRSEIYESETVRDYTNNTTLLPEFNLKIKN